MSNTEPTVMVISPYSSGITNKLTFMAKGLQSEHDADTEPVYIECYKKENGESTIRISTETGIWCEFQPYDKDAGELLPTSVAVNLYDLFNTVDQCADEMISFWIDDESNELVLNSMYNPTKDIDELEVRFSIIEKGFARRSIEVKSTDTLITTIELNQMALMSILSELNVENSVDGVNMIIRDGKLKFQSVYAGLKSNLVIKEYANEVYPTDVSAFIPFNIFNLMMSTGEYKDIKFNIYVSNIVTVDTDEYKFVYRGKEVREVFSSDASKYEDYFIIDAKLIDSTMKLINKLTQQVPVTNITFEKVTAGEADISAEFVNRFSISIRTDLAMLSDKKMTVDAQLFAEMMKRTGLDAIKVKVNADDGVYIGFENQMIIKQMEYDHSDFSKFRTYSDHK